MEDRDATAARLEMALEMFDDGVMIMRENLQRRYPEESAEEIEARLGAWLAERPGAESGDGVGVRAPWPRVR
ncbi:MAG TPA: hypothetical protein VL463_24985 [Kofleriaceae bacterium]|jgi:hypothetical protein|nr:hypothetical protein [Kofleriaceae bacterium]